MGSRHTHSHLTWRFSSYLGCSPPACPCPGPRSPMHPRPRMSLHYTPTNTRWRMTTQEPTLEQMRADGVQASGTYYVKLPDSRIQRVAYSVNADGGYIAEVSYEGEAVFPEVKPYVPSPAPSYSSSS